MADIRITLGAAALLGALALAPIAASAQPCAGRDNSCSEASPGAPLSLDQFTTARHRTAKAAHAHRTKETKTSVAATAPEPSPAAEPAAEASNEAPAAAAPSSSESAPAARPASETNGVAVTDPDQWNELDAEADDVKVVSADELNEIDLAAPPPAAESLPKSGLQSMASADDPDDPRWIGKLLAIFGATLAAVAAARLLMPRRKIRDA